VITASGKEGDKADREAVKMGAQENHPGNFIILDP